MRLLIATTNPGKIREFRQMLGSERFEWSDLASRDPGEPVEETGHTFRANACLKATAYAKRFDTWAVADDSGLEVDALGGDPGVYSARWAEMNHAGKGDADNNALLLKRLAGVPDEKRTGRFVCVLALADPQGRIILTARETVEGHVIHAPRGSNGFGYDPLFVPNVTAIAVGIDAGRVSDGTSKTTAELSPEEKHAISHRGKALRRLRELIDQMGLIQKG